MDAARLKNIWKNSMDSLSSDLDVFNKILAKCENENADSSTCHNRTKAKNIRFKSLAISAAAIMLAVFVTLSVLIPKFGFIGNNIENLLMGCLNSFSSVNSYAVSASSKIMIKDKTRQESLTAEVEKNSDKAVINSGNVSTFYSSGAAYNNVENNYIKKELSLNELLGYADFVELLDVSMLSSYTLTKTSSGKTITAKVALDSAKDIIDKVIKEHIDGFVASSATVTFTINKNNLLQSAKIIVKGDVNGLDSTIEFYCDFYKYNNVKVYLPYFNNIINVTEDNQEVFNTFTSLTNFSNELSFDVSRIITDSDNYIYLSEGYTLLMDELNGEQLYYIDVFKADYEGDISKRYYYDGYQYYTKDNEKIRSKKTFQEFLGRCVLPAKVELGSIKSSRMYQTTTRTHIELSLATKEQNEYDKTTTISKKISLIADNNGKILELKERDSYVDYSSWKEDTRVFENSSKILEPPDFSEYQSLEDKALNKMKLDKETLLNYSKKNFSIFAISNDVRSKAYVLSYDKINRKGSIRLENKELLNSFGVNLLFKKANVFNEITYDNGVMRTVGISGETKTEKVDFLEFMKRIEEFLNQIFYTHSLNELASSDIQSNNVTLFYDLTKIRQYYGNSEISFAALTSLKLENNLYLEKKIVINQTSYSACIMGDEDR